MVSIRSCRPGGADAAERSRISRRIESGCARDFADQFTDLSLTIDGVAVADLQRFRVRSPVFQYTAAQGNVFGVPAGTTRSVADGYWVLIRPLSLGTHTVSFGGAFPPGGFTTFVTYTLTVTS